MKKVAKYQLTLLELENILRHHRIFETFGITQLGVFGSFARGEEYGDIDFLLEEELDYETRKRLKTRLARLLKSKIDIVPAKFADPIILYRAQKELKYVYK
ncbi:nucleotidyltransferase family protein [Runella sp. SP2]|uniref:nucleotidyltransferase family protein n=1 Tax=Runella sp. SP2 TaxID=2268026 RepID=UPI000F07F015|nr:nucleotidyltransferase domain-containing protein [Runella sp. SP2]AYQ36310.1 nucleotidyltransferase domain-containing protein [Runella sp. SP2]